MRTGKELENELGSPHNWQTKQLVAVDSLADVIPYLLNAPFVVEIDSHMYDVSFGYNQKETYIGYSWSSSPSPHLTSDVFLNKAFRIGKWYAVKE